MYQMKPEYYTGIEFIDQEHIKLFEIANKAYEILSDEFITDRYDYILEVINELKDYAKEHFAHEESYMESINYKRILSQKVSHNEFIEKINGYDFSIVEENQKGVLLGVLEFLNSWLVDHIYKSDRLIAQG